MFYARTKHFTALRTGMLIALMVSMCGTAFADLVYINDDGTLTQVIDSQGTTQELSMSGDDIHSFTLNGQPRLLVTTLEGDIMIFDPENMSEPLSSGTIAMPSDVTLFKTDSVAQFGSNIALALKDCHSFLIINPETCTLVDTYTEGESSYMSVVYPYAGQIVVVIDTPQQTSYQDENGTGYAEGSTTHKIITMDSSKNITGTLDNFAFGSNGYLEASGGELYFTLGGSGISQYQGIYRVSGMLGNMNINNAVRMTTDNPYKMTRDGRGGLYYTAFGSDTITSTPRYIYHWDGSTTSQVYDAGSGYTIDDMTYDIRNGVIYAEILDSTSTINLTALTAGSDGRLTASNSFGYHRFTVMGNPADSSSSNSGGNADTPTQTTELPSGIIEPAPALSADTLEKIASLVSIDVPELHFITHDNISSPQEPTQAMKDYIKDDGYEAIYKLNTLTVSEAGYYVFKVTLPDGWYEQLKYVSINDLKFCALFDNGNTEQANSSFILGLINTWEFLTLNGEKLDVAAKEFLMVGLLDAATPFGVYLTSSSNNRGNVVPDTPNQTTELPAGIIEPAPALSADTLDKIASLVSTDASALHLITQENISSPQEPTQTMKQYINDDGYEPAYKLNTLTVSEDGYYVFLVNIPDEFVGKSINDIRIYALKNADFAASIPGLVNGLLNLVGMILV